MVQLRARPARVAYSTAVWFRTGSTPGIPAHTSQTLVLGSTPNVVGQEQNSLDLVQR